MGMVIAFVGFDTDSTNPRGHTPSMEVSAPRSTATNPATQDAKTALRPVVANAAHRLHDTRGAHTETRDGIPGVRFAVWAPNARQVAVIGDFNGWNADSHPLQPSQAGVWQVFVPHARAGERYKFALWGPDGKKEGVVYYARAGRSEAKAAMPLEIAPLAANGTRFALLREGKPVAGAKLTVITPDKWSKSFVAGPDGAVEIPVREKGRYLLSATHEEKGDLTIAGGPVNTLYHMATTTFVVP